MHYHHYNLELVVLSYIVSVLGSFTALKLIAGLSHASNARQRSMTLVTASGVMGVGAIWAMHFIAMLACRMPVPVTYDATLTAVSALVAVVACLIGLSLTSRGDHSMLTLVTSGTYMGIGVAAMHYLGMYAMRMPAATVYDGGTAALSVVIAILASIAALWIGSKRRGTLQTLVGSLIMGVGVCGMHYMGMAAAKFVPGQIGATAIRRGDLGGQYLGLIIFGVVFTLLVLVLLDSIRRQRTFATGL
ncbi:MHYT domain-containing protein [Oleiagrimonas sp.]|uniref:MHYT domain-containing protein n=1 Tax=Oleiagrimonas sp. TaxID=2010330 RepID=UPI00263685DE|nr:MHYT domain-containing protein [Oleiagrimonas sp.]MDA3915135.1 hypothetical protein [Oleiagrimonas sp.]